MDEFIKKNKYYILAVIVILAAVLIFTGLTRADIQHDDATYAFRSVGYLDFMNTSIRQTTPIQWFGEIPWWGYLSFHDHPPLTFIIQFIFFNLFGSSLFIARLPFALMGLGSVLALYFLGKELYNVKIGLLASFLLAISSYHSWASKIGYLEPLATLLIILSLFFFVKSLKNPKYFIHFGIVLGLTLLSKYTVWFILPTIFIYLLVKKRQLILNKKFILAILIALVIFSPVIIYNTSMFQARGHFDLQLASLFNQDLSDWPGITRNIQGVNFLSQIKTLFNSYSILVFVLLVVSIIYLLTTYFLNFKKQKHLFIILLLFFSAVLFSIIGAPVRLLSVLNPIIALAIAVAIVNIHRIFIYQKEHSNLKKNGLILFLFLAFLFEIFYNINTNILHKPIGEESKHYSIYRWEAGGFNNLESYLLESELVSNKKPKKIRVLSDITTDLGEVRGKDMFVYDPDLNWFSTLWYFARYDIYYDYIFISAADLATAINPQIWLSSLKEFGIKDMYFIMGKNDVVISTDLNLSSSITLEQGYQSLGAEEHKIFNKKGELAFIIYKLKIN